ncbi:protein of unknown function [Paraburkholderia dioscoreae]|uniref:Uncharacterized protein n=1 Tax=Paraburkholderia dioscoreae TaxID=2604047 RepID=A0A5Q4ZA24_9BURK|nr:protein of unknown function [Paraburkholderia dioscoreae]
MSKAGSASNIARESHCCNSCRSLLRPSCTAPLVLSSVTRKYEAATSLDRCPKNALASLNRIPVAAANTLAAALRSLVWRPAKHWPNRIARGSRCLVPTSRPLKACFHIAS